MLKGSQNTAWQRRNRRAVSRTAMLSAALLGLLLGATGCEEKTKKTAASAEETDAGVNRAVMDKNIEKAVKSVAGTAAPTNNLDGPPPTGVFGPGLADKAHPSATPAKVEIVAAGDEPRIKMRPPLEGSQKLKVTVRKRYARQNFPTIDYFVTATAGTPKADDEDAEKKQPAAPSVLITVDKAMPSAQQPGQLPEDVSKQIAKLAGTTIRFALGPAGALGPETLTLPKDAPKGLSDTAGALAEVFSVALPPWPAKPMGKGAYWMGTDRAVVSGVPVVRYRVTRVDSLKGDEVAYSIDLRQYAVDGGSLPVGVPAGFQLSVFQAQGKAGLTRKVGTLWPSTVQIKSPIGMQLGSAQQQGAAPVQIETEAVLAMIKGDDKAPKK